MNNINKKRLFDNFISLSLLQVASYILPLISLPYLSRVLDVNNFGLVFFALAFIQYFNILTDYGFELSATREISINRHNKNSLASIVNSVILIKMILALISFIILCIFIILIPKLRENSFMFLSSFLIVIGNSIYPSWFFRGMEKMKYITFLNILAKLSSVILIFAFIKNSEDSIYVPLLYGIGFLLAGIIGFYLLIKSFKLTIYIPKFKTIKKQFKYSTEFFLSRASLSMYSNTNTFLLGLFSTNAMVACYAAAEKIYLGLESLIAPISSALYPYISKYKDYTTYRKIFKLICILNTIICSSVFIFSKDIISMFYGSELTIASTTLRIFCITVLISTPCTMLGFPLLGASGHTKSANYSVILGFFVQILGIFILFLFKSINANNIAITVLITEMAVIAVRIKAATKYKLMKAN